MSHDDWALAAPISARATRCRIVALVRCEMWRVVGVGRACAPAMHPFRTHRTCARRASFSESESRRGCAQQFDRKSQCICPFPSPSSFVAPVPPARGRRAGPPAWTRPCQ